MCHVTAALPALMSELVCHSVYHGPAAVSTRSYTYSQVNFRFNGVPCNLCLLFALSYILF